jgi:hypothetical protein
MTMPNSAKGARAQRRADVRHIRHEMAKQLIILGRIRDHARRENERKRRRYARLSVERLIELGTRHGLVEEVGDEVSPSGTPAHAEHS